MPSPSSWPKFRSAHTRAIRRIARKRDVKWIARVGDPGEASWAFDLHPVVEDLDPNVIAAHAVGAVDHRVDQALQPGILRNETHPLEAT
jgi:hypothetical protein